MQPIVSSILDPAPSSLMPHQIDFDSGSSDYDPIERVEFWESIREWLSAQGYTLARRFIRDEYDDNLVYVPTHENPATQQHPYAPFWGGNFNPPNPLKPELSEPTTVKKLHADWLFALSLSSGQGHVCSRLTIAPCGP